MATHEIKADLDVDGEVQGTSLDINGNADISGNLTGLDNVTSTNFIIGGHTINDVDITSEDSNADDHLMTSKAIVNLIADNENSFLTSVPNHSGNLITSGTVAAARVATLNQNTTGSSGSCTGNAATATVADQATNLNAIDDRDMAPEDRSYSDDFRIFFTSKEGLEDGTSTGSNWQDALFISSYSDSSGGNPNVLAFDKSEKKIYHYQASATASNWGTAKQLAYTDSVLTTAAQTNITSLGTLTTLTVDNIIINGTNIGHTSDTDLITLTSGKVDVAGELECSSLDVDGNGDVSGTLTIGTISATNYGLASGDIPNNAANTSGTAAIATTITVADESSDTSCNVLFTTAATGNLGPKSGTNLTFNSSSGVLTATGFAGALTGNVTGNASGSSGSCTGNAATATLAATSTIASDTGSATHFPVFVDGSTGSRALKAHSSWNYNPGTSTLTAGKLTTDVAAIVENNKDGGALMTLTGQGAGNEANICLKMVGTEDGNPIKMKMTALDDSGSGVGAGILSYDAEDDSFGIGQNSSHNRMAIKMENTITSPVDGSTYVYYEPTSIKAREYIITSNSSHYDFYGDIMRNGNDTTVRGKMYCFKNGTWTITNADTKLDANGLLGMALGTNSTTHGMLLKGTFTLDYDPGGIGNPLYISTTDGLVSTTVPSTSGHIVRLVGYLVGGAHGNLWFNPDSTYVEVA